MVCLDGFGDWFALNLEDLCRDLVFSLLGHYYGLYCGCGSVQSLFMISQIGIIRIMCQKISLFSYKPIMLGGVINHQSQNFNF